MIITIDGPAGSGKSTAARKLAAQLHIPYLDTGAMYRVVGLAAMQDELDLTDETAITKLAATADYQLDCGPTHVRVVLRGQDVSEAIRKPEIANHSKEIAKLRRVREVLVAKQRDIGSELGSMVSEGRDQGSVAFPNADHKFYMIADLQTRAERRFHELCNEGEDITLDEVIESISSRDESDAKKGGLCRPEDAIEVDTSRLAMHEVLNKLLTLLADRGVELPDDFPTKASS